MPTRQIFNANTQKVEEAELSVDANNEIVAEFTDGSILKFPAGLNPEQFEELLEKHETENSGKQVITPEYEAAKVAERNNSLEIIGAPKEETKPDNTMPVEGQYNDEPDIAPIA